MADPNRLDANARLSSVLHIAFKPVDTGAFDALLRDIDGAEQRSTPARP